MDASKIVLAEGAAIVGMVTIANLKDGKGFPPPKVFLAGAVAYGALALLAGPAPQLAITFGALGVAYGLLRANGKGISLGESAISALTGIGTGTFEAPGSQGGGSGGVSFTPVTPSEATTGASPATGASGATPALTTKASGTIGSFPVATKPSAYLGGVNAHAGGGKGGVNNWESSNALDIAVPKDTPVLAVENGTIGPSFGFNTLGGNRLHLVSSDNEWYYAHLDKYAPGIGPGTKVTAGQIIGYAGNTGDASGGPVHLHLASLKGNPASLLGVAGQPGTQ